ncbi:MAG TPA: hypothetical protein VM577_09275 [Anaerovoracaceae bacterium]|nr:hypothetical protein [Anaerovoracaceae bacterium]
MSDLTLWQRIKDMCCPEAIRDRDVMKKLCLSLERKASPEFSLVVEFVCLLKNFKEVDVRKEDHRLAVANYVGVALDTWERKSTSEIVLADVIAFVDAYHNTGSEVFSTLIGTILAHSSVEAFEYFFVATYYGQSTHSDVSAHSDHIDFCLVALEEPNPTDRSPRLRQFVLNFMKEHASEKVVRSLLHRIVQADSLPSFENLESFFNRRFTPDDVIATVGNRVEQSLLTAFGGFDAEAIKQMSVYKFLQEREHIESERDRFETLLSTEDIKPGKKAGLR